MDQDILPTTACQCGRSQSPEGKYVQFLTSGACAEPSILQQYFLVAQSTIFLITKFPPLIIVRRFVNRQALNLKGEY